MTESELRVHCPNVYKSYRAKKGAVTRLAKRSGHLRALAQYTCYDEKPASQCECIVELHRDVVIYYGIWHAVQTALIKAGKIGEGSVEFWFTRVVGFDENSHSIGEVNF